MNIARSWSFSACLVSSHGKYPYYFIVTFSVHTKLSKLLAFLLSDFFYFFSLIVHRTTASTQLAAINFRLSKDLKHVKTGIKFTPLNNQSTMSQTTAAIENIYAYICWTLTKYRHRYLGKIMQYHLSNTSKYVFWIVIGLDKLNNSISKQSSRNHVLIQIMERIGECQQLPEV